MANSFFAPSLALEFHQAHLFQHGQQRIDHAGARRVGAADAMFDLLDDLVAVAGLLCDQRQHDELEIALIEHAAHAAPMAMTPRRPQ